MRISKELAQVMVKTMRDVINKDLNYIDTKGMIIASTDPTRIGQRHAGAMDVLKKGEDVLITANDQYPGSKMGINIPVMFHNKPIGVFGITGDPAEVMKYGELLKRLTEILVNDAYLQEIVYKDRFNEQLLIESILFFSHQSVYDSGIEAFNYDASLERRAVYGIIDSPKTIDENQLFSFVRTTLSPASKPLISINNNMLVMLLVDAPEVYDIESEIADLVDRLEIMYRIESKFTIGTRFSDNDSAKASFNRAQNLFNWAERHITFKVKLFDRAELGIIASSTNPTTRNIFLENILKNLSSKELSEYRTILNLYEKHDGSITKTADELAIHKNTLQYRLNRLTDLTTYNPRELSGFCTLKIAFMLL